MLKRLLNNPYSNAIRNIRELLEPDQKRRGVLMVVLLVINALADVFGLATVGALIKSALENDLFAEDYNTASAGSQAELYFNNSLRWMYEHSGADSPVQFLFFLSIGIFLIFVAKNAMSLWIGYVQTRYTYNVARRLNMKMFKHYYDKGYLFIQDSSGGKKVYSIVDIPTRFAANYMNTAFQMSTDVLVLLLLMIGVLAYRPLAILMLAAVIVPFFIGMYALSKNKSAELGKKRNIIAPINYGVVLESMSSFVDVKLGNRENRQMARYFDSQKVINDLDTTFQGIYGKLHLRTNDLVLGLGIMVIFGYAWIAGIRNETILTLLTVFGLAGYKMIPGINRIFNSLLGMKNNAFVIEELKEVAQVALTDFDEVDRLSFKHKIHLDKVSFAYPESDTSVLEDIDLTIKHGESLGIIGSSGSGKTTLLKLILRLIREDSGKMSIDQTLLDSKELDAAFQLNIGYVEQSVFITNGTLAENIAFGEEYIDSERLLQAVKDSMLSDFIQQHKEGLNLELGENGVKLSGGQKQRVGIARALYKNAEILIFDEVTSALDPGTEKAIVKSINHIASLGKTVIIVAHRITTLEKCDRIIELKNGKIVGEPLYADLINEMVL